MRKFTTILTVLCVALGFACCSTSDSEESVAKQYIDATFTVELSDLGTRSAGKATMIDKVEYGIYDVADGGRLLAPISSKELGAIDFDESKAVIDVRLAAGKKYDLVFFAYSSKSNAYSVDWENRLLNVSYKNTATGKNDLANLESRDAFFHVEQDFLASTGKTFVLNRPFAQLNAGQSYSDFANMLGNKIIKSSLTTQAYTQMSLGRDTYGNVLGSKSDVVFELNDVVDVDDTEGNDDLVVKVADAEGNAVDTPYKHLSMNYLLVNSKELVNVEITMLGDEGTLFTRNYPNIPLERNYRTNIIGNLISSPFELEIVVNPIFTNDHNQAQK